MNRFWNFSKRYLFRYLWWYLLGFLCVFITQWMMVGIVDQTKQAVDAVVANGATARTVMPFAGLIAVFALLVAVVRTASRLLIFTPGRMIEYNIRNKYYQNLLYLQRDFLSKHESGDLVSRCSNDISYIRAAYGFGALQVGNVTITLVMVLGAMMNLDVRATLYLVIPMALAFIIIQTSIRYYFGYWRLANEQLGGMASSCLASYKGIAAIQNYHAEPRIIQRFSNLNQEYLNTQTTLVTNRAFVMPLVQLVGNLSAFLILLVVGAQVINGDMTIGEIVAFLGYIGMVMPPLLSLGWMLNVFSMAVPAMERLDEILLAKPDLPPTRETTGLEDGTPVALDARHLNFHYQSDDPNSQAFHLQDIELKVSPGKIIGIVGPLGCGKTTLLDCLVRLNKLEPERIYLNGNDAAFIDLDSFRTHFSFAPQNAFLFSTTLRKNLQVSLPVTHIDRNNDERLIEALKFAGFDLDPKQFPHGLETEVGEKGVMLSGGQRQRIALARALLKQADIYVLDDVLSAVDHDTEKQIIANIREFAPGKSFIIASHRVSAIQWADEILVMENGRITNRGKHNELTQRPGFYRDIYRYQSEHEEAGS